MFKHLIEVDRAVADRIAAKIIEQELPIETEVGLISKSLVKMLFIYKDYKQLNRIITESINEEYDLL